MMINRVRLALADPHAAGTFFAEVLDLPVEDVEEGVVVTVGRSRLELVPSGHASAAGVHHLAFDVPAATFADHRSWLEGRVPLLRGADGTVEFEGPPAWDSRSVYFSGPEQMVLELIARRSRQWEGPVDPPRLTALTEVGVAVDDVPAAVAALNDRWGLGVLGSASTEFAPVGDDDGLFILVTPGRGWLPVFDVESAPLPLQIEVTVEGRSGTVALSPVAGVRACGQPFQPYGR